MNLPIFKYFYRASLKSWVLWISSFLSSFVIVLLLLIYTFSIQSNSSYIGASPSILLLLLFVVGAIQITIINMYIFNVYFAHSQKDGTMSLEIRSGIPKYKMFFERILLSKVWSVGTYLFYVIAILLFSLSNLSPNFSYLLVNFAIGFVVIFLYDLFLSAILSIVATFGTSFLVAIFGLLILIMTLITPMSPALNEFFLPSDISWYISSKQIYKDVNEILIAEKVRTLANDYKDGFTQKMLDSYKNLSGSVESSKASSTENDDDVGILTEKEIYDIAISGLITEFSGEGIKKYDSSGPRMVYKYSHDSEIENSEILIHLNKVKSIFKLENGYYLEDNNMDIWKETFYKSINSRRHDDKFLVNFDSEYGFNNLMSELNKTANEEEKKFYKIIDDILKSSFVIFRGYEFDESTDSDEWNYYISNSIEDNYRNNWFEDINLSVGARMYQTAFFKAINSAINLPVPKTNLGGKIQFKDYFNQAKISLYSNPWIMFNKILSNDYIGNDLLWNRYNMSAFNRTWVNREIIYEVKDKKSDANEYFSDLKSSNFIKIQVKDQIFNCGVAIAVWMIFFLSLYGFAFIIFVKKMKQ